MLTDSGEVEGDAINKDMRLVKSHWRWKCPLVHRATFFFFNCTVLKEKQPIKTAVTGPFTAHQPTGPLAGILCLVPPPLKKKVKHLNQYKAVTGAFFSQSQGRRSTNSPTLLEAPECPQPISRGETNNESQFRRTHVLSDHDVSNTEWNIPNITAQLSNDLRWQQWKTLYCSCHVCADPPKMPSVAPPPTPIGNFNCPGTSPTSCQASSPFILFSLFLPHRRPLPTPDHMSAAWRYTERHLEWVEGKNPSKKMLSTWINLNGKHHET